MNESKEKAIDLKYFLLHFLKTLKYNPNEKLLENYFFEISQHIDYIDASCFDCFSSRQQKEMIQDYLKKIYDQSKTR